MKKKYNKPTVITESLALQTSVVTNCVDADLYWMQLDMGDGHIIFVEEIGCNISDKDYMALDGDDDGSCYYAYTDDGKTFNS